MVVQAVWGDRRSGHVRYGLCHDFVDAAMTEESIIDKIRKLLALSNGTDNEAEAASAAAMAQRLMSQHSIEEAMLDVRTKGTVKEDIVNPQSHMGKYSSWKGVVLEAIAGANGCGSYKSDRNEFATHHSLHLFGRDSDIALCRELFEWVVAEIDHLARIRCPGEGRTFAHNYRYGCAEAVSTAIKKEFDAAEANALARTDGTGMALIVVRDALALRKEHAVDVHRFGRQKIGLRTTAWPNFNPDAAARLAGRQDGAGIYQGKSPTRRIT